MPTTMLCMLYLELTKLRFKAVDIIIGDISDDLKKQVKNKIPDDATKRMGLYSLDYQ